VADSEFSVARDAIADLIEHVDDASMPAHLIGALRRIATVDCSLVLAFRSAARPQLLFDDTRYAWRANTVTEYLGAAYLIDPFYVAASGGIDSGVYRLAELAPDDFRDSEYYRAYYARSHVEDELCYLTRVAADTTLVVSLERRRGSGPFSPNELARLRDVEPIVRALLNAHWRVCLARAEVPTVVASVQRALAAFGDAVLTPREREVARLMLGGHSTRSLAQQLGISPGTAKIHRERIYAKLGVSQHAQLFRLFIDSLCASESAVPDSLPSRPTRRRGRATPLG
jgi:DNA-binding CsgD family transcriptional regulator